jgi:hypothetical protein
MPCGDSRAGEMAVNLFSSIAVFYLPLHRFDYENGLSPRRKTTIETCRVKTGSLFLKENEYWI